MAAKTKKSVALIGDDVELFDVFKGTFGSEYDVHASLGDPGALRVLHDTTPAAIVLDLDMATFDPFELLRLIAGDPDLQGVPVLVLASDGSFATFDHAHRAGATEFLAKPVAPEALAHKLDAIVNGRQARAAGRLKLGTLLTASGLVSQEQVDDALSRQHEHGGRLGEVLVSDGVVTEEDIVYAVAGQMHIGVVDLAHTTPQPMALGLLPRDFLIRRRLMPLSLDENGSMVVAMTNPLDVISIDEIGIRTKKRVIPVMCTETAFDDAVAIYFSSRGKLMDAREEEEEVAAPADIDADIIAIVDDLLTDAATMGASDIHLEPREDTYIARCRIDGVLHEMREYPKELQAGVTSRLKIMGNLNIAERRLPQDGRATFELSSGETVDLRLASIPSMHGENITIRILEQSPLPPTLASLGMVGDNLERFEKTLRAPEGGIVIVGPTGSGKSTTLYTTLELIKTPERKVYTVEDPIERKIEGIIQTEVKPSIGLTFAQALRSLVRADPDIIMVGEIRDVETAKMAADSAVTGHQVFSTLHTNDAASAVNRLVEMGVPRYLVAAAWRVVVAQRLVRKLCTACRRETTMTSAGWEELGLGPAPARKMTVFEPVGCTKCFQTGYRGRLGLYEVMAIDDELRDLIATGGSLQDLQHAARSKGVRSLREDGVAKVLSGETSYLELLRVTI